MFSQQRVKKSDFLKECEKPLVKGENMCFDCIKARDDYFTARYLGDLPDWIPLTGKAQELFGKEDSDKLWMVGFGPIIKPGDYHYSRRTCFVLQQYRVYLPELRKDISCCSYNLVGVVDPKTYIFHEADEKEKEIARKYLINIVF